MYCVIWSKKKEDNWSLFSNNCFIFEKEAQEFADKQRTQARDIYGKKASDILVSEGTKRQDYMSSLIAQVMADRDLMSSWIDYEG